MEIIDYFIQDKAIKDKSVADFFTKKAIANRNETERKPLIQPQLIIDICERLCQHGEMIRISAGGDFGFNNNYCFIIRDKQQFENEKERNTVLYNSIVYGFEYIFDKYKDIVVPIVYKEENGFECIGTGIRCNEGIATARHCLEGISKEDREHNKTISIKGIDANTLEASTIYVSKNEHIDLAFIFLPGDESNKIFRDEPRILDEVLAMGFPIIAGFQNFLTGEKATISAISDVRLTPTRGTITSVAESTLAKTNLMLITAKIKGGNSGGPIIASNGCLVGISTDIPKGEGLYDDLGYGAAYPISELEKMINEENTLDKSKISFCNFNTDN